MNYLNNLPSLSVETSMVRVTLVRDIHPNAVTLLKSMHRSV